MHTLAADIAPGILEQCQRLCIFQKIDTDLFQNGLGIGLDDFSCLVGQNIDGRCVAGDEGRRLRPAARTQLPPRITSTTTPRTASRCCCIIHGSLFPVCSSWFPVQSGSGAKLLVLRVIG